MARTNEQRITRALELEAMALRHRDSRPDISTLAYRNARILRRTVARKCAEARA